jgi:hypothetical protein
MAWAQIPSELVARSLYNARVLWRRPISARFGDMGSLLVATPDKLYVKEGTGVLILDPETGAETGRIEVTNEPRNVRWLAISDGVLLTLAGPKPLNPLTDLPGGMNTDDRARLDRMRTAWRDSSEGQELVAWNGQTGKELWRFTEARIAMRKLLVQSILVHAGVAYATAGVQGRLDGSAMCAVDARTGVERWAKVFRDGGKTDQKGRIRSEAPSGGGQIAWYDGRIWWQGLDWGPAVVDPAGGVLKHAVDSALPGSADGDVQSAGGSWLAAEGNWRACMGKDIGILPGGWVAVGNDMIAGYKIGHVLLRCGPDGAPGDRKNQPPQILSLAKVSGIGIVSNYVNREIPVWDDSEVLTHGDGVKQGSAPTLYRGFAEALNKEGDAHPLNVADYGKYTLSASEAKNPATA